MPTDPPITVEQIRRSAAQLTELRPNYRKILSFYQDVFVTQELAKGDVDLEPIHIPQEEQARKRSENLPLTALSGFVVDGGVGKQLLIRLCGLIEYHDTAMKPSAMAVLDAVERGRLQPDELFESLLAENDLFYQTAAERIGADKNALAFMAYHSIQPCVEQCAAQLAHYLENGTEWRKGFCPVCGSVPGLAVLGPEGRRDVYCSFCRHGWRAPRIFCPFCETTHAAELHYWYHEEEKDLRVDVCDRCRRYIKTVDGRVADRPIHPPLEQVASLHLDIIASQKGFYGEVASNLA